MVSVCSLIAAGESFSIVPSCCIVREGTSTSLTTDPSTLNSFATQMPTIRSGHERLRRYGVPGQIKQDRSVAELDFVIGHAAPPQPMVTVLPPCALSV